MPWGVTFPLVSSAPVHPTQLYESFAALLTFGLLIKFRNRQRNFGEIFLASASLYSFFRFFIEFFRAENPVIFMGMKLSQLIGIIIIIASFYVRKQIDQSRKLRILPETETKELS
jgi:phosphatidylglycerol:prolipoprotein diacylglycerol transferase